MIKNYKKGFTLIELLVVIAIIGILASIVLASLSTATRRANDGKITAQLSSMRAQAQIWTPTGTVAVLAPLTQTMPATVASAINVFGDTAASGSLKTLIEGLPSGTVVYYGSEASVAPSAGGKWFLAATTSSGTSCVDYTGATKTGTIVIAAPTTTTNWTTVGAGLGGYTNLNATNYSCN